MKVLLVGGSGKVGTFITPYLLKHHEIRVLDVRAPTANGVEFFEGSVLDERAIEQALAGCDTFINLVMMGAQGGFDTSQSYDLIKSNYEVNTLGLHLLLYTAQSINIKFGVHTSSMSVHFRKRLPMGGYWYPNESAASLQSPSVYGLTKGFGEMICEYFSTWFDMNLVALRITGPRTRDEFLAERRVRQSEFETELFVTDEEDLALAYLAAIDHASIGHGNFESIFISGDENEIHHNMSKAKRLLGWFPQSQKYLEN